MERLTERLCAGGIRIKGCSTLYPDTERKGTPAANAIVRFAAYEDTGMTPEEIEELLHKTYGPLHKKLGQWIAAERDGRLMILPPNDPLTLEELREMGGEPVWVECLGNKDYSVWAIVDLCLNGIHTKYFYADFDYYGDEWLSYRRKPEEG